MNWPENMQKLLDAITLEEFYSDKSRVLINELEGKGVSRTCSSSMVNSNGDKLKSVYHLAYMMEILEGYCINLDKLIEKEGTCRYLPFAYHIFEVLNEKERQYLTACIKHDYVKDAVMLDISAADRSRNANIESIMTTITDSDSQYMRDCKKFLMEVDNRLLNLTKPEVAEKAVGATSSSPTDTKKAKAPAASRKRKVENDDKTGDTTDASSKSQKKFITKTRRHWTVASSRRIVNSVDFTDFFSQFVDIISRVHGNSDSIIQKLSTICIDEEMNECVDILRQKEANDVVKKQKELDDINKLAAIAAETSTSGGGAVDDTADINDQLNDEDKMEMENNDPLDGAGGKKQSNKAISSKIFNDRSKMLRRAMINTQLELPDTLPFLLADSIKSNSISVKTEEGDAATPRPNVSHLRGQKGVNLAEDLYGLMLDYVSNFDLDVADLRSKIYRSLKKFWEVSTLNRVSLPDFPVHQLSLSNIPNSALLVTNPFDVTDMTPDQWDKILDGKHVKEELSDDVSAVVSSDEGQDSAFASLAIRRIIEKLDHGMGSVFIDKNKEHVSRYTRTYQRAKVLSSVANHYLDTNKGVTEGGDGPAYQGPVLIVVKIEDFMAWEDVLRKYVLKNHKVVPYIGTEEDRDNIRSFISNVYSSYRPWTSGDRWYHEDKDYNCCAYYSPKGHCDVMLVNYKSFVEDFECFIDVHWHMMIMDEPWGLISNCKYTGVTNEIGKMKVRHRICSCSSIRYDDGVGSASDDTSHSSTSVKVTGSMVDPLDALGAVAPLLLDFVKKNSGVDPRGIPSDENTILLIDNKSARNMLRITSDLTVVNDHVLTEQTRDARNIHSNGTELFDSLAYMEWFGVSYVLDQASNVITRYRCENLAFINVYEDKELTREMQGVDVESLFGRQSYFYSYSNDKSLHWTKHLKVKYSYEDAAAVKDQAAAGGGAVNSEGVTEGEPAAKRKRAPRKKKEVEIKVEQVKVEVKAENEASAPINTATDASLITQGSTDTVDPVIPPEVPAPTKKKSTPKKAATTATATAATAVDGETGDAESGSTEISRNIRRAGVNSWSATISFPNRIRSLGMYPSEESAIAAYNHAAKQLVTINNRVMLSKQSSAAPIYFVPTLKLQSLRGWNVGDPLSNLDIDVGKMSLEQLQFETKMMMETYAGNRIHWIPGQTANFAEFGFDMYNKGIYAIAALCDKDCLHPLRIFSHRCVLGRVREETSQFMQDIYNVREDFDAKTNKIEGISGYEGIAGLHVKFNGSGDDLSEFIHISDDPSVSYRHAEIIWNEKCPAVYDPYLFHNAGTYISATNIGGGDTGKRGINRAGCFQIKALSAAGIYINGKKRLPSDGYISLKTKTIIQIGCKVYTFTLPNIQSIKDLSRYTLRPLHQQKQLILTMTLYLVVRYKFLRRGQYSSSKDEELTTLMSRAYDDVVAKYMAQEQQLHGSTSLVNTQNAESRNYH